MTSEKDNRLVDYLYGELSDAEAEAFERELESDDALSTELAGFEETLTALRAVEAQEPLPHLDSLILANARQAAEADRGWLRKLLGSPVAGLVAAGSVAMIVAVVTVPSMMLSTSEQAPASIERIPEPILSTETVAEKLADKVAELEDARAPVGGALDGQAERPPEPASRVARQAPKKKARHERAPAPEQKPAEKPAAKVEAAAELKAEPKQQGRARTTFGFTDDLAKDAEPPRPASPAGPTAPSAPPAKTAPPAPPPQPAPSAAPMEAPADAPVVVSEEVMARRESVRRADRAERREAEVRRDEAVREDRGRSMLAAASEEFKRGNPQGGRQILVRALSVVGDAPVHAEIAFRLAQHDFDRGAYAEAVRYARIAASAPKFEKRKAALDLVVAAEKKLAEQRSRGDTDEAR